MAMDNVYLCLPLYMNCVLGLYLLSISSKAYKMISPCFSLIGVICQQLVGAFKPRRHCKPLPDDIIIDIVSRLPAEHVLKCQRVCKKWKSLTSTPYFTEMHLKRSNPLLILSYRHFGHFAKDMKLYLVDEWGDASKKTKPRTRSSVCASAHLREDKKEENLVLAYSYDGLLVFMSQGFAESRTSIIYNPVTHDKLTFYNHKGSIYGVFFHPIAREYCVLWAEPDKTYVKYRILSLGKKSFWRRLPNFAYLPRRTESPVILNDALHWMSTRYYAEDEKFRMAPCSKSIVVYSIIKEEFYAMPHPELEYNCKFHCQIHLLNHEGHLSLYQFSYPPHVLDIWILEDYESWFWTRRHKINLALEPLAPICEQFRDDLVNSLPTPLGVQNEELLLFWRASGLFAYHLQQKTLKKFEKEINSLYIDACLHSNSLVSLKEFQSAVYVLPDD